MMISVKSVFLSCSSTSTLSDLEHNSSLNRPVGDREHGVSGLLQKEDAVDMRAAGSVSQQLHQRVVHAGSFGGKLLCPGADEDADDGIVLQKRQIHRDLWNS